jgi:nicotinic acid mononucleotide adenylyltransferase
MLCCVKNDILGESFPNVKICDYEIMNGKFLPTYDLLRGLKQTYPDCEFYMCVGADLIDGMKYWDDGEKLKNENKFIIMEREGYLYDKNELPKDRTILETSIYGSSTSIRNRMENNSNHDSPKKFNIYGLTTKSCIQYMITNKLYQ